MGDENTGDEEFGAVLALQTGRVLNAFFVLLQLLLLLLGLNSPTLEVLEGGGKIFVGLDQLLPTGLFRAQAVYIGEVLPLKLLNIFS